MNTAFQSHQMWCKTFLFFLSVPAFLFANDTDSILQPADSLPPSAQTQVPADSSFSSTMRSTARAIKDTVLVLTRSGAEGFLTSFHGERRSARERGYGGGLCFSIGPAAVNVRPVQSLVLSEPQLQNRGFNFANKYELFVMTGGIAYGALGNGFRIGGAGWGGSRDFVKLQNDTTFSLEVSSGYGGVFLEKAKVIKDANLYMGGIIGGGNLTVTPNARSGSAFGSFNRDEDLYNTIEVKASYLLLEIHGGLTYSCLSWLHIGFDIGAPFFISTGGFKTVEGLSVTDGFVTVNPVVRLRFVFGNIG
jgi:hypothetical protein